MSYEDALEPVCSSCTGSVSLAVVSREKDLGGFTVRRVLPASEKQMVGPFIFFDHMGPAQFPPGKGIDVRPHPHIGIATITYLFEGEILHRDSLGVVQPIQPGAVNLMTAGSGIVHSERPGEDFQFESTLHGIQSWMALPDAQEEMPPAFAHTTAAQLPELEVNSAHVRVIMGEAYGLRSPVTTYTPTLYLDCQLPIGCELNLPHGYEEMAAYIVSGVVVLDSEAYEAGTLLVVNAHTAASLRSLAPARVMVIGGAKHSKRYIWWNFVSSSLDRIERAKQDWAENRFAKVIDDDEFIPLPRL
ncbi:MAG: pirin family protein [bacterium]